MSKVKSIDEIQESSNQKQVISCHLPRPDFKIIAQKKEFITHGNNDHLRKVFTRMFKAEGFGRGTTVPGGKYGKPEYRPIWWSEELEKKCSWEKIRGVEKPKNWQGVWTMVMYEIILSCYKHYLKESDVDEYVSAKNSQPRTVDEKKIDEEPRVTEDIEI